VEVKGSEHSSVLYGDTKPVRVCGRIVERSVTCEQKGALCNIQTVLLHSKFEKSLFWMINGCNGGVGNDPTFDRL